MGSMAGNRITDLLPEEYFCVSLLRAVMVQNAVLVLDRPFSILTNIKEDNFIMESLKSVDDLFEKAYVYDCIWRRLHYRRLDGAEI
jgi:hypothetical protein